MVSSENNSFPSSQPASDNNMRSAKPIDDALQMLDALRWQVEMGADEAIMDTPDLSAAQSITDNDADQAANARADTPTGTNLPNQGITDRSAKGGSEATKIEALDVSRCQTLEELRQAAAAYDGSDLKRTATQIVFADGDPASNIMFIGEAPGADEDRQGKPFVGVSGQLLNRMLLSIGLPREQIYITNTILWRPPGNRTPTAQETAQFMPVLRRHIQLVAPKILVCLGGAAAKAVLATNMGILKIRGQWYDFDAGEGLVLPVMPTLHPAYLLRSPQQKALAWKDFRQIAKKIEEIQS